MLAKNPLMTLKIKITLHGVKYKVYTFLKILHQTMAVFSAWPQESCLPLSADPTQHNMYSILLYCASANDCMVHKWSSLFVVHGLVICAFQ